MVSAIVNSPLWSKTLLIITYDVTSTAAFMTA